MEEVATSSVLDWSQGPETMTDPWYTSTDLWNSSLVPGTRAPPPAPRPTRLHPKTLITFKIADKMYISTIILFCVSSIGNILSLAVLFQKALSSSTSSVYLRALAVSDFMTVWAYFMVAVGKYFENGIMSDPFCKAFVWLEGCFQQISSYLVICMTVERLLAVVFPLKVAQILTKKMACCVSLLVYIAFMALQIAPIKMVYSLNGKVCVYDVQKYKALFHIWIKLDPVISLYIPGILIFILNGLIIASVRRARKRQLQLQSDTNSSKTSQASQITRMLLTVSITYWFLNLPMAIYFFGREYFFNLRNAYHYAGAFLTEQICVFLMLTNNSINFFLYCLSGRKFRKELLNVLRCKETGPPGGARSSTNVKVTTSTENTKTVALSDVCVASTSTP